MSKGRDRGLGWTLGVAIFLAAAMGMPGKSAKAAPSQGAQGLMRAHEAIYHINAHDCADTARPLKVCFDPGAAARFAGARTALRLRFTAWGRSGALAPARLQAGRTQGNRIAYRGAGIEAWWLALPIGYEQGFTVLKSPPGKGPVIIELHANHAPQLVDGDLDWGALRYGKLYVRDAMGRALPAKLHTHGRTIQIRVDDAGARYPLVIDPLVWVSQRVTVSGTRQFGDVTAIAGNTALVMASKHVYTYTRANGIWTQDGELIPSIGNTGGFGGALSLNATGTVALVGAPQYHVLEGAAFVFTKTSSGWIQTAELSAGDAGFFHYFGNGVALNGAGTVAVVGAEFAYGFTGRAYVFSESNGSWSQAAEFSPSTGVTGSGFGATVSVDSQGTTAIVGCPGETVNGHVSQGAEYVFSNNNGTWAQETKLTSNDGVAGDQFGAGQLDAAGTEALIGAPSHSVNGQNQGAAYIFTKQNGTWGQSAEFTASDGTYHDGFGFSRGVSLSSSGATALIGAPRQGRTLVVNPKNGLSYYWFAGAAYLFQKTNGSWRQVVKLTAGGLPSDKYGEFGSSTSISGDSLLIGSAAFDPLTLSYADGSAYFYTPSDLSLALDAPAVVQSGQAYLSQAILTNSSASASAPISAFMPVPPGATYVSAVASQGSCARANGGVNCELGRVSGNAGAATVSLKLVPTATQGQVTNQVNLPGVSPSTSQVQNSSIGSSPSLSGLTDLQLQLSQSGTETFSVGGTGLLTVNAHSSNQTLLPDSGISGAGSCNGAGLCALAVQPASGQTGTTQVTVTVSDAAGQTASGTFTVNVTQPLPPSPHNNSGGGGSLGWLALAALFGLALADAWARRRG